MVSNGVALLQPLKRPIRGLTEAAVQEMIRLTVLEEGEFSLTLGDNAVMWTLHSGVSTEWKNWPMRKAADIKITGTDAMTQDKNTNKDPGK